MAVKADVREEKVLPLCWKIKINAPPSSTCKDGTRFPAHCAIARFRWEWDRLLINYCCDIDIQAVQVNGAPG